MRYETVSSRPLSHAFVLPPRARDVCIVIGLPSPMLPINLADEASRQVRVSPSGSGLQHWQARALAQEVGQGGGEAWNGGPQFQELMADKQKLSQNYKRHVSEARAEINACGIPKDAGNVICWGSLQNPTLWPPQAACSSKCHHH